MTVISKISSDTSITGEDKLLGTDSATGAVKNYPIQFLFDSIAASASNIFLTRIITVQEEIGKDFISVINQDLTGFTVQTGEVAFIKVLDVSGDYKSTYVMIRPVVTAAVTYGFVNTVSLSTFLLLHETISSVGEVNTASSAGGTYSIVNAKSGTDLPMKGISSGSGINITDNGTSLSISSSITQAEINTLQSKGSGNATLVGAKTNSALGVKSINFVGANITNGTDEVTVDIWKRLTVTTSFTLSGAHDKTTIWVNNGLNDVIITIPIGLSSDFSAAIIQLGTGNVTMLPVINVSINGADRKVSGQDSQAWIEKSPIGTDTFMFLGNTKA